MLVQEASVKVDNGFILSVLDIFSHLWQEQDEVRQKTLNRITFFGNNFPGISLQFNMHFDMSAIINIICYNFCYVGNSINKGVNL